MDIDSIKHKGLKRFFETGNTKGLIGDTQRLKRMLAFINAAEDLSNLTQPPNFGFHRLVGRPATTYSMIVTKNWRLTFSLRNDNTLINVDLEDYHGT